MINTALWYSIIEQWNWSIETNVKTIKIKNIVDLYFETLPFQQAFPTTLSPVKNIWKKGIERVPKTIWLFLRKENVPEKLECIPKWKGQEQI